VTAAGKPRSRHDNPSTFAATSWQVDREQAETDVKSIDRGGAEIKSFACENPDISAAGGQNGVTVAELAASKALPYEFLRANFWLMDDGRRDAVTIPYRGSDRHTFYYRSRIKLAGDRHTIQPRGVGLRSYGLWRLAEFRAGGRLILVEGESDVWTGWFHGLPVLGVPGANAARACLTQTLDLLAGFSEVFVWREPGRGGEDFVAGAGRVLAAVLGLTARVLTGEAAGAKDLSALHLTNPDPAAFRVAFDAIMAAAEPMPAPEVHRVGTPVADPYAAACSPDGISLDVRLRRLIAYLGKLPPAVAGQGGHAALMAAARACYRFGIDRETSVGVLRDHFNPRCQPEWSDRELKHKVDDAWKTAESPFGAAIARPRDDLRPRRTPMDGLGADTDPSVFEALAADRPAATVVEDSAALRSPDLSDLAGPRVIDPGFKCPVADTPPPVTAEQGDHQSIPAAFAPPVCRCLNPCSISLKGAIGGHCEGQRAVIDVRGKGWQCCDDCFGWNQGRWAGWFRRVASWWANPERAAATEVARPASVPDRPHGLHVALIEPADWGRVKKQLDRCDGLYATITTVKGCVNVPSLLLED
jgi:hypothetical protein